MMHVVLHEPEIPQNTGNIARTCKSTGAVLHLIQPLGFHIDDKSVKRAGLDYWHEMDIRVHDDFQAFSDANLGARLWLVETYGDTHYHEVEFRDGDYLVFGKETLGLPKSLCQQYASRCIRVPMVADNRSLNLSNTVAIVLYEALRQTGFTGMA